VQELSGRAKKKQSLKKGTSLDGMDGKTATSQGPYAYSLFDSCGLDWRYYNGILYVRPLPPLTHTRGLRSRQHSRVHPCAHWCVCVRACTPPYHILPAAPNHRTCLQGKRLLTRVPSRLA